MSTSTAPQWSGPGIMQSFISLKPGTKLSQETLEKWFEEEYIPAILDTGIVTSAVTWKAADPEYKHQGMVIYKVPDLTPVKEGKLKDDAVSRKSSLFPTDGPVDDFIEFESRILSLNQYFEVEKQPEATKIIYAALQPAPGGEADLDAWYREEHNEQMSKEPGYKRTTRFRQLLHMRNDGKTPSGLDFVAIHEFGEGNKLGKVAGPLDPITDWTKRCMSESQAIDVAVFTKVKSFGKAAEA
ncbi:hypothetical protein P280DRAFT_262017 [Massarina eburnea CBS 473.64]|uniref:EthD domain-containing protein n=1 Tax=Massarina eburnea CBS 473.64 TaxID=1395130 RepID=A0A6A6S6A0_9PLEO|nr:hypothetical protein P280DRAFT_262017 [Massarina eburnea CBS 473.64]